MCNDYRLEVDIASIAEDFEDLQIKIKMPEGAPNVPAREDIKIAEMAPILRSVEGERGIGELVNRRWSWPGPRGIHIICDRITDHDEMLRSIGRRAFSVAMGRGDGANHGGGMTTCRWRPSESERRTSHPPSA